MRYQPIFRMKFVDWIKDWKLVILIVETISAFFKMDFRIKKFSITNIHLLAIKKISLKHSKFSSRVKTRKWCNLEILSNAWKYCILLVAKYLDFLNFATKKTYYGGWLFVFSTNLSKKKNQHEFFFKFYFFIKSRTTMVFREWVLEKPLSSERWCIEVIEYRDVKSLCTEKLKCKGVKEFGCSKQ